MGSSSYSLRSSCSHRLFLAFLTGGGAAGEGLGWDMGQLGEAVSVAETEAAAGSVLHLFVLVEWSGH